MEKVSTEGGRDVLDPTQEGAGQGVKGTYERLVTIKRVNRPGLTLTMPVRLATSM